VTASVPNRFGQPPFFTPVAPGKELAFESEKIISVSRFAKLLK